MLMTFEIAKINLNFWEEISFGFKKNQADV